MKYVDSYPFEVRKVEHFWITMPDGTRLAAKLWLPKDIPVGGVPGILEFIPYRKRDKTSVRDSTMHPYIAGHGYACLRVDLRGSGESDGILTDEYTEQEIADGVELVGWLAKQDFCNGNVGMIGISWGGFNGLQVAAENPEPLKAIMTVCSTDDRYADDVHYMGGCLLGDNLSWASTMFAFNSCPPDPALVGERWRDMWLARMSESGLWIKTWLAHQHRDAYWRHGSVCEDYERVQCAVYCVSGWADGYSNSVFRMMERLSCPRKALVGPWGHRYPHMANPGPGIDFLGECLRWWDYWLKDIDNGIMDEPQIRGYMQDSLPPTTNYAHRPGRWVSEDQWPSPDIECRRYTLTVAALVEPVTTVQELPLSIQSPLSVGLFAGKWCSFSATPDLPHDQREEDGGAIIFNSERLPQDMEIFGSPYVELTIACNKPNAMLAVRLSDVLSDDSAARVTFGLLNLTHRTSHEAPEPLEPGRRYRVRINLNEIAHVFPAGHRFRLSFSTSYWPIAWPSPEPPEITIYSGSSHLCLPVRGRKSSDESMRDLGEECGSVPEPVTNVTPRDYQWLVTRDLAKDLSALEVVKDEGIVKYEATDLELHSKTVERYSSIGNDYNSIKDVVEGTREFARNNWRVKTITRTEMTSDQSYFYVHAVLDAYEDDQRVFTRVWRERIRRQLM